MKRGEEDRTGKEARSRRRENREETGREWANTHREGTTEGRNGVVNVVLSSSNPLPFLVYMFHSFCSLSLPLLSLLSLPLPSSPPLSLSSSSHPAIGRPWPRARRLCAPGVRGAGGVREGGGCPSAPRGTGNHHQELAAAGPVRHHAVSHMPDCT